MRFAKWKQYIHPDWSELRQSGARHYFKAIDLPAEQCHIQDLEEELEITLPADLMAFYQEVGIGFLWAGEPRKKGHYRVFSPASCWSCTSSRRRRAPRTCGSPSAAVLGRTWKTALCWPSAATATRTACSTWASVTGPSTTSPPDKKSRTP